MKIVENKVTKTGSLRIALGHLSNLSVFKHDNTLHVKVSGIMNFQDETVAALDLVTGIVHRFEADTVVELAENATLTVSF